MNTRMPCGRLRAALAVLALMTAAAAHAETLEQAWVMALSRNSLLAAAGRDVEAARSTLRAARAERRPSLDVSAGYTRFGEAPQLDFSSVAAGLSLPIVDDDDFVSGGLQARLPLFTGGRISANIGAAERSQASAEGNERAQRADLKLRVAQAYLSVLRARRQLQSSAASEASLAAHVQDAERLVSRELVPRSDLLAARVAWADSGQRSLRARHALELAGAAYNREIGEPLDRPVELEEPGAPGAATPESLDALIAAALEARPEPAALDAAAEALEHRALAERAAMLPAISLTGGYTYLDTEVLDRRDFNAVGVSLTWKLFDGGAARDRMSALRAQGAALRRRAEDLRSRVDLEVRAAALGLAEARGLTRLSAGALESAAENLRIARELYASGLGTNTQVLDAVALQVAAANNRDDAALGETLAALTLRRAVGDL